MSAGDHLELEGVVVAASKGIFEVEVPSLGSKRITCKPSGKLRQHRISLVLGDRVLVRVSPYDTSTGFIPRRL